MFDDDYDYVTGHVRVQRLLFTIEEAEDENEVFSAMNSLSKQMREFVAEKLVEIGRKRIDEAFDTTPLHDAFVKGMGGE